VVGPFYLARATWPRKTTAVVGIVMSVERLNRRVTGVQTGRIVDRLARPHDRRRTPGMVAGCVALSMTAGTPSDRRLCDPFVSSRQLCAVQAAPTTSAVMTEVSPDQEESFPAAQPRDAPRGDASGQATLFKNAPGLPTVFGHPETPVSDWRIPFGLATSIGLRWRLRYRDASGPRKRVVEAHLSTRKSREPSFSPMCGPGGRFDGKEGAMSIDPPPTPKRATRRFTPVRQFRHLKAQSKDCSRLVNQPRRILMRS